MNQTLNQLAPTKSQIQHVMRKENVFVGFLIQGMMDLVMKQNVMQKKKMDFALVSISFIKCQYSHLHKYFKKSRLSVLMAAALSLSHHVLSQFQFLQFYSRGIK